MLALTTGGVTRHLPETHSDRAMRLYWDARNDGDASAKLIRIDGPPPSDILGAEPGTVSTIALERIQRDEAALTKAGFAVPPPIYAPGTRVVPLGDENFRVERSKVENMPIFPHVARTIRQEVQAECREDLEVSVTELQMLGTGAIEVEGEPLRIERGAFSQLANVVGFGAGTRYLTDHCGPALRAMNVNEQLTGRRRHVKLRTRLSGGHRSVYAVVTPTYAAVDTDQVLEVIEPALADAHTQLRYDGSGISGSALWMPDTVVDLAAGDIFKAGVRIETDDTGRGRIRISAVVWRNLCLNLIIIGQGEVETVNQVHRGDPDRILSVVADGVSQARDRVGHFLDAWGHARSLKVDARELLREMVEERRLRLPGVRSAQARDQVVEALLAAWDKEPGNTLADTANALTRAAHENTDWPIDFAEELERYASKLVMVPA